VTDEFQRPAGRLSESPATVTGILQSLSLPAGEDSPATASIELPSAALVASSRRALREAEKSSSPARRRSRERVAAARPGRKTDRPAAGRASGRRAVEAPARPTAARQPLAARLAQKAFPPIVMLAVGALLIGTNVPAVALLDPEATPASEAFSSVSAAATGGALDATAVREPAQVLEVATSADAAAPTATRDDWTVTSYAEVLRERYGSRTFAFTTSGTGAVRWPFPTAVTISSGFGGRVAPCYGCSSYHQGLDFTPGAGAPIYAIADGVVTGHTEGGAYGNHVFVDHIINGQRVTSLYAHMIWGSSPLVVGQQITAGEFIGQVGSTGASTGAHLHLEIHLDGVPVDPYAWLTANAS
jgi:murein DD-endopeptidase MepM/ murein hydrolase activator NlpD